MDTFSLLLDISDDTTGAPVIVYVLAALAFFVPLIWAAVIDWKSMILPNKITLPLIVLSMVTIPFLWGSPVAHAVSGFLCGGFFYMLAHVKVRGQFGWGMGDTKVYTALGFALGPAVLIVAMLASIIGMIGHSAGIGVHEDGRRPHGPDIVFAGIIVGALMAL